MQFLRQSWKQSGTAKAGAGEDPTIVIVHSTLIVNADKASRREGRVENDVDDGANSCFDGTAAPFEVVGICRIIDCFTIILLAEESELDRFWRGNPNTTDMHSKVTITGSRNKLTTRVDFLPIPAAK